MSLHLRQPASGDPDAGPPADALAITFTFARPMSAVLCGVRPTPLFFRLHVFGRDGSVEAVDDRELVLRITGKPLQRIEFDPVNGMRLQLESFAQAVAARAAPENWPIPPADMLGTIAALEAVVESMRCGAAAHAVAP